VYGIPIAVDASWVVILVLVTWTLATGYFPLRLAGAAPWIYWSMGVVAALFLFLCVLLHELGHSVVAKRSGIPVHQVTLFIFGGVAHIARDPASPAVEFRIALAGPLVSVAIAAACFWLSSHIPLTTDAHLIGVTILRYLAMVNAMLVAFNLLPGFPLDGGRLLRAVLWAWTGGLHRATKVTCALGRGLGIGLIGLGVLAFIQGRWIGGWWYLLIGFYLYSAAKGSYQQLLIREGMEPSSGRGA